MKSITRIPARARTALALLALLTAAGCATAVDAGSASIEGELAAEQARTYASVPFRGVNLTGPEWGQEKLQSGVANTDYIYPDCEEITYFVHAGMNTFRLPFRWERLQKTLGGPLDEAELGRIQTFVDMATARGAHVILEPHNFGAYGWASLHAELQPQQYVIGGGVGVGALADMWGKLAARVQRFQHPDRVMYGLMNEPEHIKTTAWFDAAGRAVKAIRDAGAKELILVPGVRWTGAHAWAQDAAEGPDVNGQPFSAGASSADGASAFLADVRAHVPGYEPIAFDVHEYVDANFSGTSDGDCTTADTKYFDDFRNWLSANRERGFVTEFAVPASCADKADEFARYFEANASQFLGWTYWTAGPGPKSWWKDYFLSIEPGTGESASVMPQLAKHLDAYPGAAPTTCDSASEPPPSSPPPVTPPPPPNPPAPPTNPTPNPPPPPPQTGDLTASLQVTSSWDSGYCVDVHVWNHGQSAVNGWTVTIDTPSAHVTQSWESTTSTSGTRTTFQPVADNRFIGVGASADFGFCAAKDGSGGPATVVSVR